MSKNRAFESLLSQNYSTFIPLTMECIGVSVYDHPDDGNSKIFDSRASDKYGRSHSSGI